LAGSKVVNARKQRKMSGAIMDKLAAQILKIAERLNIIDSYSCKLDRTSLEALRNRKPNAAEVENRDKEVINA
jgi:hypothetical protein